MLEPSSNFTAEEVQFLQNEASEWISYVNSRIIEAASAGKSEVYINITDKDPIGCKYWRAPDALIEHFKSRGFGHKWNGQCTTVFTWEKKEEGQREFINIQSLPDQFEFNGERVDGKGLKDKLKKFLFGDNEGRSNA
jgi:hypothetical protein